MEGGGRRLCRPAAIAEVRLKKVRLKMEEVRQKTIGVIARGHQREEENISSAEHNALQTLNEDDHIVIQLADKSSAWAFLDKCEYKEKGMALLSTSAYARGKRPDCKDPGDRQQDTFRHLQVTPELSWFLPQADMPNGSAPALYGLPKIHKSGAPIRPIVDFTTSPLLAVSTYLHQLMHLLSSNTPTYF
ncbi:hypothetical protein HPB47_020650 [Ixodes persulcatus]|uniref:Uncharacterized protein n=1 Tax=Ixodes persulcatus TaxID=34615 RepID=A0AC60QGS8_IXOPE|nr:hypothetical protein HPB47_020650 [Ixodes persulcatus]